MPIELIPKLPAQDFAFHSHGNICRKLRSDSPKMDAISRVNAMVFPRSVACEGYFAGMSLCENVSGSRKTSVICGVGRADPHKMMCLRKNRKGPQVSFSQSDG